MAQHHRQEPVSRARRLRRGSLPCLLAALAAMAALPGAAAAQTGTVESWGGAMALPQPPPMPDMPMPDVPVPDMPVPDMPVPDVPAPAPVPLRAAPPPAPPAPPAPPRASVPPAAAPAPSVPVAPPAPAVPVNVNVNIRVLSPGDNGDVHQSVEAPADDSPASAPGRWSWDLDPGCDCDGSGAGALEQLVSEVIEMVGRPDPQVLPGLERSMPLPQAPEPPVQLRPPVARQDAASHHPRVPPRSPPPGPAFAPHTAVALVAAPPSAPAAASAAPRAEARSPGGQHEPPAARAPRNEGWPLSLAAYVASPAAGSSAGGGAGGLVLLLAALAGALVLLAPWAREPLRSTYRALSSQLSSSRPERPG